METKTHNGWSNYETWRVNLECVDPVHYEEQGATYEDVHAFADAIKEEVEALLDDEAGIELAKSYAHAFLSDVNWHEIAKNIATELPAIIAKSHA